MKQTNYLNSTALTPINHEPYTQHGGGGGFKKVVAVVAAVAIPIAAPMIASTIGLSTTLGTIMSATAAKVASGAIVGAGLGAIAGEVTGTGATRGALMGGISGGIGGYYRGSVAPTTQELGANLPRGMTMQGVDTAASPTFYEAGPSYEFSSTPAVENVVNPDLAMSDIQIYNDSFINANDPNIELASFRTGGNTAGNIEAQLANNSNIVNASTSPNVTMTNTAIDPGSGADLISTGNTGPVGSPTYSTAQNVGSASSYSAPVAGSGSAADPYAVTLTGDRASDFGNVLYSRFTDPRALADVAIQSAVNLIGSQVYGTDGATDQEKQLLQEQQQMLDQIKEQDRERYDFIMKQATAMFNRANNYDPSIMARAALIQQKNRNEINRRNAARRINFRNPGLRAAEDRRFAISNAATEGSAYDRGMMAGLNTQSGLYKSAAAMFPGSGGNYSSALTGLRNTYANIEKRKADQQAGLNQMFGAFGTSKPQSPYKGLTFKLV